MGIAVVRGVLTLFIKFVPFASTVWVNLGLFMDSYKPKERRTV